MAARNLSIQFGLLTVAAKADVAIEKQRTDMVNVCVGQPTHKAHPATPLTAPNGTSAASSTTPPTCSSAAATAARAGRRSAPT